MLYCQSQEQRERAESKPLSSTLAAQERGMGAPRMKRGGRPGGRKAELISWAAG